MSYYNDYKVGDLVYVRDSRCLGCITITHDELPHVGLSYEVYLLETGNTCTRVYAEEMTRVMT